MSTSSSPKGSQNGFCSPRYAKNERKNANQNEKTEELPIKSTSKRVPTDGWWSRVEKEIPKTLSHIGTAVNLVKNNATIRPIFVMGSFWFYEGMPNYQRVMATLNKIPKLRGINKLGFELALLESSSLPITSCFLEEHSFARAFRKVSSTRSHL